MKKLLKHLVFLTATVAAGSAMAAGTFYDTEGFGGQPIRLDGVVPDFRYHDYNDRAVALVVEGVAIEVCSDINFGGNCQVFAPGSYPSLGGWSRTISSMRPVGGYDQRANGQRGDPRGYGQRGADPRGYVSPYGYPQGTYDQRAYQGRDRGNYQYPGDRNWNGY